MARALLAALLTLSAAAVAQTAPAPTTAPGPTPPAQVPSNPANAQPAPAPATQAAPSNEEVEAQINQKVEAAKKEMREEIRAQLATQSASQGWQEEWVEQARKLELLELDGYFRVRPDLFYKFDLNRNPDPDGYFLFPRSYTSAGTGKENTIAGVNMRARIEPTINVSEEVRVKMQIDALDNVLFGSTPLYASHSKFIQFGIDNITQVPPVAGQNALTDSIVVKRAYGEVSTPVGILRFGRMGSNWGTGMLYNDGNCIDCDFGDNVDRIQFVAEPFSGWYIAPMIDFNTEGPAAQASIQNPTNVKGPVLGDPQGQPFDASNSDDAHSYVIAIQRRDTEQQERARLENGLSVFNFGVHFSYTNQNNDPTGWADKAGSPDIDPTAEGWVLRNAQSFVPDLWAKYERKDWAVEAEVAGIYGTIQNRALNANLNGQGPDQTQNLTLLQFGAVARGEYRFLDGQLKVNLEGGFASGDKAPGLGAFPNRVTSGEGGSTVTGNFDGRQYRCATSGPPTCSDSFIRNFRFNRDYRIDMILWREILGDITDALYVKPTITYRVAEGFDIFGTAIGSWTVYEESSPSETSNFLGIELNAGAQYQTEDGFYAQVRYGIFFPQAGMSNPSVGGIAGADLDTAQSVRAILGIKY